MQSAVGGENRMSSDFPFQQSTLTPIEASIYVPLLLRKEEMLDNEAEFFIKAGFDPSELYLFWDWTWDDVQIVPDTFFKDSGQCKNQNSM